MERLTFDGNFCDIAMCTELRYGSFCPDGACSQRKVWERLKYYEDNDPVLQAENVAPVRHGKWIDASISGVAHYRCTECGEYIEAVWTANFNYHYCPNCGARMDGAE